MPTLATFLVHYLAAAPREAAAAAAAAPRAGPSVFGPASAATRAPAAAVCCAPSTSAFRSRRRAPSSPAESRRRPYASSRRRMPLAAWLLALATANARRLAGHESHAGCRAGATALGRSSGVALCSALGAHHTRWGCCPWAASHARALHAAQHHRTRLMAGCRPIPTRIHPPGRPPVLRVRPRPRT